ncbi:MAG TPA: hypothetical protein VL202_00335 [Pararhizobium sp.]|uniref:hypothetical protein n=1 Tax=Pararhizobium sp. TaxID=1977563 RepID=UPI002C83B36A|nr:hypothetical protein [Pararhizobium sp.]HTO29617.1 hypothetical protein [Pararhizobium sp.]
MQEPAVSANQKRLDAIRNRAGLAAKDWGIMAGERGLTLTANGDEGQEDVSVLLDDASIFNREFAIAAPEDLLWLLDRYTSLADRFRRVMEKQERDRPKPKQYAAECAMKCNDRAFLDFLFTCHGVDVADKERIISRVRTMLRIQSRAELDTDEAAASRWRQLVNDFENWRKAR